MIRPSSTLLALAFVLAACSTQTNTNTGSSQSSASSASGVTAKYDTTAHSGTYANTTYGFSLRYPTHFEPLQQRGKPYEKNYGAYIEDNELKFKGQLPALMSVSASDRDIDAIYSMSVDAFPLQGYTQTDIYSDEYEYAYDAKTDTWTGVTLKKPFTPDTRMIGGKKAYQFVFGDAGWSSTTYAVPLPEKNVVLEFSFGGCVGCTKEAVDGLSEDTKLIDTNAAHIKKETDDILKSIVFQ